MSNEKQTVTLRFSKETVSKCKELAKLDHRSLNNFIERLMEKAIHLDSPEKTQTLLEEIKSYKFTNGSEISFKEESLTHLED